jgi:uncharacterized protein
MRLQWHTTGSAARLASRLAVVVTATLAAAPHTAAAQVPAGATWSEAYVASVDGTRLHADVFRPAGVSAGTRTPVIVDVGPYFGSGTAKPLDVTPTREGPAPVRHQLLAIDPFAHGYTVVDVSLRGFGGSEGCLDLIGPGEQADAKAAVEWAAAQPWSTGRVAIYGASYDGAMAVAALAGRPKGLAAAIVISPLISVYRGAYMNRTPYSLSGYSNPLVYASMDLTPPAITSGAEQHAANLSGTATHPGCQAGVIAAALNPDPSARFWRERDLIGRAADSTVPSFWSHGLLDTGVHPDNFLDVYKTLRGPHHAWVGQFPHAVPAPEAYQHPNYPEAYTPPKYEFGRAGFVAEVMRWLDRYVKGVPPAEAAVERDPANTIEEGSEGGWRDEREWPPADARPASIPLHPGSYHDAPGNRAEPGDPSVDCQDPFDPCNPMAEPGQGSWTFTQALPYDVHLAGVARLRVTLDHQASQVNVVSFVYDVDARGRAALVTRGAYLVTSDRTVEFELYPQDWRFRAGHRIGVLLSGSDDGYFAPGTTLSSVGLTRGELRLPALEKRRDAELAGGPSQWVKERPTFEIDAATIAASAVEAPLPPAMRAQTGAAPKRPVLRLDVRPRTAVVGERARFRIVLRTRQGAAVRGARVQLGGSTARTDRHGRTTVVARFSRAGVYRLRATRRGFRAASVKIRVRMPRHGTAR